ncbi:MAG TPA: phosphoglycerate kinase [Mycobacteriales bacterium]|nr:phosphoglycerate kinase [Mycobacteriales bacterium]
MTSSLPDLGSLGDLRGKRVLVRCDLNVPLDGSRITDDGRIRASLPTLNRLLDAGARLVVISHLGRPGGTPDQRYTLAPVAQRLGELLGREVAFVPDPEPGLGDADVVMLENLRFDPAETSKDPEQRAVLAGRLAALADVYVDDAFGVTHRSHASVDELAGLLPHAAGDLVRREVEALGAVTTDPERPLIVVLGGSKVSDKLAVIANLLPVVDRLLVGGGMCFTFLAAQGHDVGGSLLEADQVEACRELLAGGKITLPVDVVVAERAEAGVPTEVVAADAIPADRMGLDIGPRTVAVFTDRLADARTIFWNGPMGVFEIPEFAAGTRGIAEAIAARTEALTVVGGGDSAAAIRALGIGEQRFSHISTGGGASLEFVEGRTLPGLAALER